jgi:hypothetical protein
LHQIHPRRRIWRNIAIVIWPPIVELARQKYHGGIGCWLIIESDIHAVGLRQKILHGAEGKQKNNVTKKFELYFSSEGGK